MSLRVDVGQLRRAARAGTVALLALAALLAVPGVAAAHAGGLTTTTSQPQVVGLQPAVPGLAVTVVEFGARLRLDNRTTATVAVEPQPGSTVGVPTVPPGGTAYWSDPRVAAAFRLLRPADGVASWQIPLRVDGPGGARQVIVAGQQVWPEPPQPLPWWLLTLAAALAAALPGVLGAGRALGRISLAVSTLVVLVAHLAHVAGSSAVVEDQAYALVFLGGAGFGLAAWPIGLAGAWLTLRGSPTGPLLCAVTGALLSLVVASTDVVAFHDAVVPFAWGASLDRLLIALIVGGGLGVASAGVVALRRTGPRAVAPT